MDGAKTVKDYYYEYTTLSESAPARPVQSEAIAELCAFELLYPPEFRAHDGAEVAAKNTTHAKLALHYNIPERVVGRVLHKSYIDFVQSVVEVLPTALKVAGKK